MLERRRNSFSYNQYYIFFIYKFRWKKMLGKFSFFFYTVKTRRWKRRLVNIFENFKYFIFWIMSTNSCVELTIVTYHSFRRTWRGNGRIHRVGEIWKTHYLWQYLERENWKFFFDTFHKHLQYKMDFFPYG